MNRLYWISVLALAIPGLALAQADGKYRCTYGDLVRRVEILTEPGVTVPCEVHYYKDTEAPGETQVLWSAQSQAGYCESQTRAFVARLEEWGWDCAAAAAMPMSDAEAMPDTDAMPTDQQMPEADSESETMEEEAPAYDDTDVLSPGDPSG